MKFVLMSDTHGHHKKIQTPEADFLIHAGDIEIRYPEDLEDFLKWFDSQPAKHKIFISGNHDLFMERHQAEVNEILSYSKSIYLLNSGVIIDGLKIWGSPYTPAFGTGWVFNHPRHTMSEIWDQIPKDTNILVTHGPPFGILDYVGFDHSTNQGCSSLRNVCDNLPDLKLHVFGHIHAARGIRELGLNAVYANASSTETDFIRQRYNLLPYPFMVVDL